MRRPVRRLRGLLVAAFAVVSAAALAQPAPGPAPAKPPSAEPGKGGALPAPGKAPPAGPGKDAAVSPGKTPPEPGKGVDPAKEGASAAAAARAVAVVGAKVHVGTGEVLDEATVVLEDGRIKSIAKGAARPAGVATVLDGAGRVLTAGFVDPLTSTGLYEIDLEPRTRDDARGGDDPIRAGYRAVDGFNPASVVLPITRAEGITSVGVVPTGGLISGLSAFVDLDAELGARAVARAPLALHVRLGGGEAEAVGGRGTAMLRVREAFDDARTFAKNRDGWAKNQLRALAPSRLDLEALALALDGKVPVVVHVDRAADVERALGLAAEYKLRVVIAGGAEAWKAAAALRAASVPVIVHPLVNGPETFDALEAREDNAALLEAAGVTVVLSTGETHNARKLRQEAGNAVRAGLPWAVALAAVTVRPAKAFGLDDVGTVAVGQRANVVLWSGDPFELATRPVAVFVRGRSMPLENRQTALLAKYRGASR